MEKIVGIVTDYGIIKGRDGIYLDSISSLSETELIIKGEFNTNSDFKKFELKFSGIIYIMSIELDFDERGSMESFGIIEHSDLIEGFKKIDHSSKLRISHKHFYFRTYDTVFEIVAEDYGLKT